MSMKYRVEKAVLSQQSILDYLLLRLKELEKEIKMYRRVVVGGGMTQSHADSRYVNVTGDTMTGNLSTTGNISATNITGTLGCSGISGSSSDLCTLNDTDTQLNVVEISGMGFYNNSVNINIELC